MSMPDRPEYSEQDVIDIVDGLDLNSAHIKNLDDFCINYCNPILHAYRRKLLQTFKAPTGLRSKECTAFVFASNSYGNFLSTRLGGHVVAQFKELEFFAKTGHIFFGQIRFPPERAAQFPGDLLVIFKRTLRYPVDGELDFAFKWLQTPSVRAFQYFEKTVAALPFSGYPIQALDMYEVGSVEKRNKFLNIRGWKLGGIPDGLEAGDDFLAMLTGIQTLSDHAQPWINHGIPIRGYDYDRHAFEIAGNGYLKILIFFNAETKQIRAELWR